MYNKNKTELVECAAGKSGVFEIPNGVVTIGSGAFWGCAKLTKITIPNGVKKICDDAFMDCQSLSEMEIPDSVESIDGWAFSDCSNLKNVTIPSSVKEIGEQAFERLSENFTITCEKGSYADTYAKENGISVKYQVKKTEQMEH